jgi:uncharacterized cupin superfamily protein
LGELHAENIVTILSALGNAFGLSIFGVNLVHLTGDEISSQLHRHRKQDVLVDVLQGKLMLIADCE